MDKLNGLKQVKIIREAESDDTSTTEASDNTQIESLKLLVEQSDADQDFNHRSGDPNATPSTLGQMECPTCGYTCEGLFCNRTEYPNEIDMDDYCQHLKYVDNDFAYFTFLN